MLAKACQWRFIRASGHCINLWKKCFMCPLTSCFLLSSKATFGFCHCVSSVCHQELPVNLIDTLMNEHWAALLHSSTWVWHGHNGDTLGTGGSDHLAHWLHTHSRWFTLLPDGSAQLRNPKLSVFKRTHSIKKRKKKNTVCYWIIDWHPLFFVSSSQTTNCASVCVCFCIMVKAFLLSLLNSVSKCRRDCKND